MHIFRNISLLLVLVLGVSCSNVRIALYDQQKRQEYANNSREAFSNSEAGKEIVLKNSIIVTAREYIGTKYKYGSTDPKQGFDCSGLVYYVGKENKIELPRSSNNLAAAAPHISWKKAKPGDLVFFGDHGSVSHVGIIEKNKHNELWVIHSTIKRGVLLENVLASSYWKKRILFAVDFSTLYEDKKHVKS